MASTNADLAAINVPLADDTDNASVATQEPNTSTRDRWRQRASKFKETFGGGLVASRDGSTESTSRLTMQDRLLNKLMTQILPDMPLDEEEEEEEEVADPTTGKNVKKLKAHSGRPELNMRAMATNFRLFNARIGVVFVFQDAAIQLFSWKHPTHTLSFLAVYTLICLQPHLIPVVPLAIGLFGMLIPNFLARHPVPVNDPRIGPSFAGPPTAPATRIKPAPEVSRDFWRNMRDLQNSMGDFAMLHDAASTAITPLVNFGDERLSSTIFVGMFVISAVALLGTWLVPYQLVALIGGWALVLSTHPEVQRVLMTTQNLNTLSQQIEAVNTALRIWVDADITLDAPPETRQVEIFELQKHHASSRTWESWLFSPTPFDPLSAERQAANGPSRPKGTQFFDEVAPPAGWTWSEKRWSLDLFSREWVEQRLITLVEVETEGERWVYDLAPETPSFLDTLPGASSPPQSAERQRKNVPRSGWEESSGQVVHGEWRRRRWTRLVQRKVGDRKYIETEVGSAVSVP